MKVGPRFTVATKMVGGRASVFFEEHTPVKTHGTSRMRLEDEFAAANYNFEISITFNDGIWKNKTWFPWNMYFSWWMFHIYVDWRVRVVATSRNGTESIQEASSAIIFPF